MSIAPCEHDLCIMNLSRRALSPVSYEPLEPDHEDGDFPESNSGDDGAFLARKRRRVENLGRRYLAGEPIFIFSASLKGPFGDGWVNPWGKAQPSQSIVDSRAHHGHSCQMPGTSTATANHVDDKEATPGFFSNSVKGLVQTPPPRHVEPTTPLPAPPTESILATNKTTRDVPREYTPVDKACRTGTDVLRPLKFEPDVEDIKCSHGDPTLATAVTVTAGSEGEADMETLRVLHRAKALSSGPTLVSVTEISQKQLDAETLHAWRLARDLSKEALSSSIGPEPEEQTHQGDVGCPKKQWALVKKYTDKIMPKPDSSKNVQPVAERLRQILRSSSDAAQRAMESSQSRNGRRSNEQVELAPKAFMETSNGCFPNDVVRSRDIYSFQNIDDISRPISRPGKHPRSDAWRNPLMDKAQPAQPSSADAQMLGEVGAHSQATTGLSSQPRSRGSPSDEGSGNAGRPAFLCNHELFGSSGEGTSSGGRSKNRASSASSTTEMSVADGTGPSAMSPDLRVDVHTTRAQARQTRNELDPKGQGTPKKSALKDFPRPIGSPSSLTDGQLTKMAVDDEAALDADIAELSKFLGTWDVETELKGAAG